MVPSFGLRVRFEVRGSGPVSRSSVAPALSPSAPLPHVRVVHFIGSERRARCHRRADAAPLAAYSESRIEVRIYAAAPLRHRRQAHGRQNFARDLASRVFLCIRSVHSRREAFPPGLVVYLGSSHRDGHPILSPSGDADRREKRACGCGERLAIFPTTGWPANGCVELGVVNDPPPILRRKELRLCGFA